MCLSRGSTGLASYSEINHAQVLTRTFSDVQILLPEDVPMPIPHISYKTWSEVEEREMFVDINNVPPVVTLKRYLNCCSSRKLKLVILLLF